MICNIHYNITINSNNVIMYEDFHGYGLQDGEYLMALEELLYDSIL